LGEKSANLITLIDPEKADSPVLDDAADVPQLLLVPTLAPVKETKTFRCSIQAIQQFVSDDKN
jgi:hypothetical protein